MNVGKESPFTKKSSEPCLFQRRYDSPSAFVVHGFTLIELLVVIAIVSILAAMLLPALKEARTRARWALCMNNQKQIAIAILMYTKDFDGFLPPHWNMERTNNGYPKSAGPATPWSFDGIMWRGAFRAVNKFGLCYPGYLPSASVFYCPDNHTTYTGVTPAKHFSLSDDMYYGSSFVGYKFYNTAAGYFPVSYAMPGVIDPAPSENASSNYLVWYGYYGGYYLPNMEVWAVTILYRKVYKNVKTERPMLFDTSFGPGSSKTVIINHDLKNANVTYWDGSVLIFPYAQWIYDHLNYGWGWKGFSARGITQKLRFFRKGEWSPP